MYKITFNVKGSNFSGYYSDLKISGETVEETINRMVNFFKKLTTDVNFKVEKITK